MNELTIHALHSIAEAINLKSIKVASGYIDATTTTTYTESIGFRPKLIITWWQFSTATANDTSGFGWWTADTQGHKSHYNSSRWSDTTYAFGFSTNGTVAYAEGLVTNVTNTSFDVQFDTLIGAQTFGYIAIG